MSLAIIADKIAALIHELRWEENADVSRLMYLLKQAEREARELYYYEERAKSSENYF